MNYNNTTIFKIVKIIQNAILYIIRLAMVEPILGSAPIWATTEMK